MYLFYPTFQYFVVSFQYASDKFSLNMKKKRILMQAPPAGCSQLNNHFDEKY